MAVATQDILDARSTRLGALFSTDNLTPWAFVGTLALGIGFVVVALLSPVPNAGLKDQPSALVLISAAAVAIERLLEVFWTFIDATKGSFWPLGAVDKKVNQLTDSIADQTNGPLKQLAEAVSKIQTDANWTDDHAHAVRQQLEQAQQQIKRFQELAPANERAQLVASTAKAAVTALASKYDRIKLQADVATDAIDAVSGFVDGVAENPGRRIMSIYAGVALGLLVAFVVGFDVFNATIGTTASTAASSLKWGVALTGVVIGLGSAPTHELIKALEKLKSS